MKKWKRVRPSFFPSAWCALGLTALAVTSGCDDDSDGPVQIFSQGFGEDTAGWYDSTTPGTLGWCGSISRVPQSDAATNAPAPSAGDAYAVVATGPCNDFWSAAEVLFGAPYAPGVDLALASNPWPDAGYETDLDIYLDPAWGSVYRGNFEFAGVPGSTLVQYAATILRNGYSLGDVHTGPHYFVDVEAVGDGEALNVGGYSVTEPGWFKFRFRFADSNGVVQVDFELLDSSGVSLATVDNIAPTNLMGPVRVPFTEPVETASYMTGWIWFLDIAGGLALPIDEHTQRRGL